jgi:phage tail sheath gpL-like
MAKTLLVFDHSETSADLQEMLIAETGNKFLFGQKLMKYVRGLMGGHKSAEVFIGETAVQASGTVTLSSHVATNTVTINGVTFTAVASGATGNQYNIGASDSDTATSLAAAINASVTALLSGYVTAEANGAVVTVTAVWPGISGNMFTLAISANGSVSGAKLTGGTNGTTSKTFYFGSAS